MNTVLIIANILSFIGNTLFTISALLKSRRKILIFQSMNHGLAIVSEYMMNAYSAMGQESVSLTRNFILLFLKIKNEFVKFILNIICLIVAVALGVLLNIFLNDNVWYGYLPVIGNLVYSSGVIIAFMIKNNPAKSELFIKVGLFINSIAWAIYGYYVQLYPIMIFNIINMAFCIISILRIFFIRKKRRKLINEESDDLKMIYNDMEEE
ncbi:MAG: YgjV family protein [Acholeplasmatales bacterium]|nr:YgjV family protein [Acholeplasmatales bacterium]